MSSRNGTVRVPYSLMDGDFGVKRIVTVYMAIALHAGKNRIAVLSLKDIIYTLGLKPKCGCGKINEQVAVTVNALKSLGYLEQAPEYAVGSVITASKKYGFKLAPVQVGRKISSGITKKMVKAINDVERYMDMLNSLNLEDDNKKDNRLGFSAETAARTLFTIRQVIAVAKDGAAHISRKYLSEKVGVSESTVSNVTGYLCSVGLLSKKTILAFDLFDNLRGFTFYTTTYGAPAEIDGRLDKAVNDFKDHISEERSKAGQNSLRRRKRKPLTKDEIHQLSALDCGDVVVMDDDLFVNNDWGEMVDMHMAAD